MENIIDYVKNNGNYTYYEKEFNEIDASILSLISYINFNNIVSPKKDKITLESALTDFLNSYDLKKFKKEGFTRKELLSLCKLIKTKTRYKDILLYNYVYKISSDEQFSAITMKLPTNDIIITYEGTDQNLSGWEEDFAMCYKFPVAAEKDAIRYLNRSISLLDKNIYILGHSKGGHLAIVASMYCNPIIKLKIKKIYNFDGPGLRMKEIKSSKYKTIYKKIEHIVPNYSVIGLLLRHGNIKSIRSNRHDLFAHSIFTWEIKDNNFTLEGLSRLSRNLDESIIIWLDEHSDTEREKIVKDIFYYLKKQNISNITELTKLKNILLLIKNRADIDVETRNLLSNFVKFNFDYYINN